MMKIRAFFDKFGSKNIYSAQETEDLRRDITNLKNQLTLMAVFFDELRSLLTEETDSGKTKLNRRGIDIRNRISRRDAHLSEND